MYHDIYNWMKQEFPDMKFFLNSNYGSPGQLYTDAVFFEGGKMDSPLTIEAAKAFDSVLMDMNYPDMFLRQYGEPSFRSIHKWYLMKNLSMGATFAPITRGIPESSSPLAAVVESQWGAGYVGSGSHMLALTTLFDFSANTGCTPLVTETNAMSLSPSSDDVSGSLWASSMSLLGAFFNSTGSQQNITIDIDKNILAGYGCAADKEIEFTVFGSDALPYNNTTFSVTLDDTNTLRIAGQLGNDELMVLTSGIRLPRANVN